MILSRTTVLEATFSTVSLIFLIFSFHLSLAPLIKIHTKTQEMALKRLYFSKFSWGAWTRTPLEVVAPSRANSCPPPPPKFLSPYAFGCDVSPKESFASFLFTIYVLKSVFCKDNSVEYAFDRCVQF